MQGVKLTVTNSVNDNVKTQWFFYRDENEKEDWVSKKQKEEDDWNYHTPGAVSSRYYDFEYYQDILNAKMSDLSGITLREFLELLK